MATEGKGTQGKMRMRPNMRCTPTARTACITLMKEPAASDRPESITLDVSGQIVVFVRIANDQYAAELDGRQAVYYSNLAFAWERLEEPGKHAEALDHAVRYYEKAQELTGGKTYAGDIDRLSAVIVELYVIRFRRIGVGQELIDHDVAKRVWRIGIEFAG